eukprot:NODE_2678_length_883_cov_79.894484_g2207_i0.p2 GENE.NODE_2678_length_883_cov_79.894484_g2207_i0~~NODE_2678_length_883_cov_79.894484_g2207_i0.p2  ORF type:complete len:112 (-),score=16.91 NODE_2678_length_883_cov_79.894484_g2207_i0:199-534(-)
MWHLNSAMPIGMPRHGTTATGATCKVLGFSVIQSSDGHGHTSAVVSTLQPSGLAASAGLSAGDHITHWDGYSLDYDAVANMCQEATANHAVLTVNRRGDTAIVDIGNQKLY